MQVQPAYKLGFDGARRVIDEHGWGRVVTAGPDGLRATYAFFLLDPEPADEVVIRGHFAAGDPQCADIEAGLDALVIFEGPWGFVSASWYPPEITDVPSTMNHVSVHVAGKPELLEGDERFDVLRRTLDRHEEVLGEQRWKLEGGGLALSERIAPQTVTFKIEAERVEAKAKLSQKMPLPIRRRIVERLEDGDNPHANAPLAAWMREHSLGPDAT
ncbi:MAG: FMN-binding negative transcriptional regulator [Baekduia sp.]